jgi:hypothetical protein
MEHFVVYHNAERMGRRLQPSGRLNFLTTKSAGLLRQGVGNTVWVIQGVKLGSRTSYTLVGAYIMDSFEPSAEEPRVYTIHGSAGVDFEPPIQLDDIPWFPALKKNQGNFGLGFNRVSDPDLVRSLVALREGADAASESATLPDLDVDIAAREGNARLVLHLRRERNRRLIEAKKAAVLSATGTLACEACGFDFGKVYGGWGEGFCEVHHRVPLSTLDGEVETRLVDLSVLCSNCHRIVHRQDPMPSVEALSTQVRGGT